MLARALLGALVWLATGCVDIRGGAVELAWQLFTQAGSACCSDAAAACQATGASSVRVHLFPDGCQGSELPVHNFSCGSNQGASAFDIPPASYCIVVDAADAAENPVATGPGPVVRDFLRGDVVELGAVALTVNDPSRCPADSNQCP
jgi:hypothetical protein